MTFASHSWFEVVPPNLFLCFILKPCTSDWDLNPRGRDSNPAKTHGLPTEITHLVSGLNEAQVLDVSLQKEFSETQSDRQEVDLSREKHTPQTECGPSQKVRKAPRYGVVSFYRGG